MKKAILIFLFLIASCTRNVTILPQYQNSNLRYSILGIVIDHNNLKLYRMNARNHFRFRELLDRPTGLIISENDNIYEDISYMFMNSAKKQLKNYSYFSEALISNNFMSLDSIFVSSHKDTFYLPKHTPFVNDYRDIDYILVFNKFYITYFPEPKYTYGIELDVSFYIINNKNLELVCYGKVQTGVPYIDPKTGAFSKVESNLYNIRYQEWDLLFKKLLKQILESSPFKNKPF